MPNTIKKLYHYTTINNLACILNTQTILFNRLDRSNDPTEGLVSDFHPQSAYIFVSCWTVNAEENFALWNMYTPAMRGVRIELEVPIFTSYDLGIAGDGFLISENECLNEEVGYFIYGGKNEPQEMLYSDDEDLLKPKIKNLHKQPDRALQYENSQVDLKKIENLDSLHMDSVAKYKRTMWAFENEYRYRLDVLPIDKNVKAGDTLDKYSHLVEKNVPPPIEGYAIKIASESFAKMKVVCGPKIQQGDKEIIEALIFKFNNTAELQDSSLKGLIK